MDYKKLYKDALERARQVHTTNVDENKKSTEYIFPELKESKDEKIRRIVYGWINTQPSGFFNLNDISKKDMLAWLEKQESADVKVTSKKQKQSIAFSPIKWYDVSLIPQEQQELLVEWSSVGYTWHDVAFYQADTKTFLSYEKQLRGVKRWCYIKDLFGKQGKESVKCY